MRNAKPPHPEPLPEAAPEILAAARRFVSDLGTLQQMVRRPDYEELRFAAWTVLRQAKAQRRATLAGPK